ncbi:MAG: hypothetical protein HC805_02865 [Alkalinema sp. RL_2_19]|nr:hypothetical protein [Alkalinema sp. RL_2_19]
MPAKALKLIPDEPDGTPIVVEFLANGHVRRLTPEAFNADDRDLSNEIITQTEDSQIGAIMTVLLDTGKAYNFTVKEIPRIEVEPEGVPVASLLPPSGQADRVISTFSLPENLDEQFIILLTAKGRIKRMSATELTDLSNRGISMIKFKDEDTLAFTAFADAGDQIVIATSTGRVLRLEANDQLLPASNRAAAGVQAMRILKSEQLVGLGITGTVDPVLLMS